MSGKIKYIELNKVMQNIVAKYRGQSEYYIFPLLTMKPSDPKVDEAYEKHIGSKTAFVNRKLKVVAGYAGITKKVTNHVARHTISSILVNNNTDIFVIQKMLNHSNISQTMQYTHRLGKYNEVNEQVRKVLRGLE